jgi:hypothetical protein
VKHFRKSSIFLLVVYLVNMARLATHWRAYFGGAYAFWAALGFGFGLAVMALIVWTNWKSISTKADSSSD